MKTIYKLLSLLFLIGLIAQCQKEEITSRAYPRIRTLPVTDISAEGATFNAEIGYRGDFEVLNYGFVWQIGSPNPTLPEDDRVIYSGNIPTDRFSTDITTTLYAGQEYVVRAFIQTTDYLVYGNNITFQSLGSKAPEIRAIQPAAGTIGDTITILGNQFSYRDRINRVYFDDQEAVVLSNTDTLVKVIVPEIDNAEVKVSLSILGNSAEFSGVFRTTTPVIDDFSPKAVAIDDTLIVTGKNFSYIPEGNLLSISGVTCEVVASTKQSLKAIIPAGLPADNTLDLTIAAQPAKTVNGLRFMEPVVRSVSANQVAFGEPVTIAGEHLSFVTDHNEIKVRSTFATIISATKDSITFLVPDDLSWVENSLLYTVAGRTFDLGLLRIKPPVFEAIEGGPITQYENQRFDIIGKNFNAIEDKNRVSVDGNTATVIAAEHDRLTISCPRGVIRYRELSRFDTVDIRINIVGQLTTFDRVLPVAYESAWAVMGDFPGDIRTFGTGFTIGNKAYFGLGNGNPQRTDFWEYDPAFDSWKRLADFPGAGREKATHFVIGNKAYIVGGFYGQQDRNRTILNDVWEFDAVTHQWTKKSDFPGSPGWGAFGFALDGLAYVGGGYRYVSESTNQGSIIGKTDVWQYDPEKDSWESRKALPFFLRDNDTYYLDEDNDYYAVTEQNTAFLLRYHPLPAEPPTSLWQYDRIDDSWTKLAVKNPLQYPKPKQGFALHGGLYYPFSTSSLYAYDLDKGEGREISYLGFYNSVRMDQAAAFAIGNYGYFLGKQSGKNTGTLWKFDPGKLQ